MSSDSWNSGLRLKKMWVSILAGPCPAGWLPMKSVPSVRSGQWRWTSNANSLPAKSVQGIVWSQNGPYLNFLFSLFWKYNTLIMTMRLISLFVTSKVFSEHYLHASFFPSIQQFYRSNRKKNNLICAWPAMDNTFQTEAFKFCWCQICFCIYTELQDDNPGFCCGIRT